MQPSRLAAERLDLIRGTRELLAAEIDGRRALSRRLRATVPEGWPPELYDRPALEFAVKYLAENPGSEGWMLWYLILHGGAGAEPVVVGIAGFKGLPSEDGTVEIGYSVLRQFQRNGFATGAVGALCEWAFSHERVQRVIAETYPHLLPSVRVLEKSGFRRIGKGSEEGIIRFELTRRR